ncbi:MAG TPA: ABC transporter ATP-binding protein [Candidatus Methylomirabilis sp.]|nr:ABC transporter ATP-binding protein [Candidatus Methylomirabilis sp.]
MALEVEGLVKRFGSVAAVDGVSFAIEPGEMLCLLGPSGCGKTTTLRCVAGLETPDAGVVRLDGQVLADGARGVLVPPHRRRFGMVFQSYAVWPHLSVFENVRYPLRFGPRMTREEMGQRTREALRLVRLEEHAERFPHQLSGGQQQRVALARALVMQPAALLFDEPLSNLDAKLREEMRSELADVQARLRVPALYVTHDQAEAMALATRIAVMHQGRIRQEGTPGAIYRRPADDFVATFLGSTNLLPGVVEARDAAGNVRVRTGAGILLVKATAAPKVGSRILVGIRPEHLRVHLQPPPGGAGLTGELAKATFLGPFTDCLVATGEVTLQVQLPGALAARRGDRVYLTVEPDACTLLPGPASAKPTDSGDLTSTT